MPVFVRSDDSEPYFKVMSSSFDVCLGTNDYLAFLRGYPNLAFFNLVCSIQKGEEDHAKLFPLSDGFQLPYPHWMDREIQLMSAKTIQDEESVSIMELEVRFLDSTDERESRTGMI